MSEKKKKNVTLLGFSALLKAQCLTKKSSTQIMHSHILGCATWQI